MEHQSNEITQIYILRIRVFLFVFTSTLIFFVNSEQQVGQRDVSPVICENSSSLPVSKSPINFDSACHQFNQF